MGNYKRRRRCKLLGGPSILRVFGSSYRFKKEANAERSKRVHIGTDPVCITE